MLNYSLNLRDFVLKNCYSDYCLDPAYLRFGACNSELAWCIKILIICKAALLFFTTVRKNQENLGKAGLQNLARA